MSYPENILPLEVPRKWLKFISKRGMYERSIRVCCEMSKYFYFNDLEQREVKAESVYFNGNTVSVDGFFRVRTDKEYYPKFGKYGIPDPKQSKAAKDFIDYRIAGYEKGRRLIQAKKLLLERKKQIEQAQQNYRTAKNMPRCEIAARLGMPSALVSDRAIEAKRNQIATLRTIKQIKKLTNETSTH